MVFFSQFLNALKIVRFPIPYSKYADVIIYIYVYTVITYVVSGCLACLNANLVSLKYRNLTRRGVLGTLVTHLASPF